MRRGGLLTILVLAGFGLLLFWQVLLSGQVFFWHDVTVAYMPLRKLAQEAVQHAHLPVWTMKLGCGFPLLAEGQCATFYPLHIIAYLGLPYYYTYSLMVYLHCLMAAVFAALLGRKLNLGWPAAAFGGLVYGFSGYFVSKVLFITVLESGAWLPLILYFIIAGLDSADYRYFLGGALALALSILGGHPQIVFYELLASAALLVAYLVGRQRVLLRQRLVRVIIAAGIVFALGAGLAAIQLAPTAGLARFAHRHAQRTPEDLRALGMTARNLAYYIHPTILGSYAENNYFGHDHYYEVCGYAGGLTLLLSLLALFTRQSTCRYRWYFVFLIFFGLFMALAKYNPLYEVLAAVPGFNYFRAPGRYLLLTTLGLAVLGGAGVQSLAGAYSTQQARKLVALCLAVLVVGGLVMLGLCIGQAQVKQGLTRLVQQDSANAGASQTQIKLKATEKYQFFVERLSLGNTDWQALMIGTAAVAIAAGLLAIGAADYRLVATVCLAVLGWQLLAFGMPHNGTAPPGYFTDLPQTAKIINADPNPGRQYTDPRLYSLDFTPPDYQGWISGDLAPYLADREILHANTAVLYDVAAVEGYRYALLPQRQYEVFEKYIPDGLLGKPDSMANALQVLRMLNVEYLISLPDLESAELEVVRSWPDFALYQLNDPMPLAWLAKPRGISYCTAPQAARDAILSPQFRPERLSAVEGASCQFAIFRPDEVQVKAVVKEAGMSVQTNIPNIYGPASTDGHKPEALLVLSMAYNPNLVARVDGKPAPIYRTNYVLCGVPVPQGKHTVTVRYESQPLRWGLVISLISVLIVLILLVTVGRYRQKRDAISDA